MYAQQINGIWTELRGNIVFSANVYQTAESLSDEQRADFGVYLIVDMQRPALTPVQKYSDPIYMVNGTTVERSWLAVDKTPDEIEADQLALQQSIVNQTQDRLDAFAKTRGYDSPDSMSKYKDFTEDEIASLPESLRPIVTKFRAESRYLTLAIASTWAKLYLTLDEIKANQRPVPSGFADIEPLLPPLEWPV